MAAPVVYPRSFKLLEEHEDSLKASESTISWGLADQDDMDMREWVATILGPPKVIKKCGLMSTSLMSKAF